MTQTANPGEKPARASSKPVYTVRYGRVRAAVWERAVDTGNNSRPMYSVTFSRSYKDGNQWRDSTSFGPEDLLVLAKAANDAHSFICGQRAGTAGRQQE